MRKAAAQCEVHHFLFGQALQELAARAVEADVAKRGMGRLAEKHLELTLKCSARHAGRRRQIDHGPVAADVGAHGIERAPYAARQQVGSRGILGTGNHGGGHIQISRHDCGSKFRARDSCGANWIRIKPGQP
jgi:hypothetical protein